MVHFSLVFLLKLHYRNVEPFCGMHWFSTLKSRTWLVVLQHLQSVLWPCDSNQGVPHSLNDQLSRRFLANRPFEGGFEATLGIFMVTYCHVPSRTYSIRSLFYAATWERKINYFHLFSPPHLRKRITYFHRSLGGLRTYGKWRDQDWTIAPQTARLLRSRVFVQLNIG